MSTVEGTHIPVMPLFEVPGKTGVAAPLQIDRDVPKLNNGVTGAFIVTLNTAVVAHWPAAGVNVYAPEF